MLLKVCIILKIVFYICYGARILAYYPTPSISHQVVFRPITNELVKRGHEVIVITTDPEFTDENRPANLTEVDIHESCELWRSTFVTVTSGQSGDLMSQIRVAMEVMDVIFENQILTKKVQKVLNNNVKFDLLLAEAYYLPLLAIAHKYNIPVIQVSSLGGCYGFADITGSASNLFVYPDLFQQKIINLDLKDKFKAMYNIYALSNIMDDNLRNGDKMIKRLFGSDIPSINELKCKVDMQFLNTHRIWDNNRPVAPNVIYMGGLHQNKQRELPKDLKNYLDSSKNGVIYVSFGTNVVPSMLPKERIKILVKVLSNVPYNVLWKWDKDQLPGLGDNIKIGKWFPQSDLLRHPNVKLFITQCGLQSTDEAITAGVPLVGIPLLGDQWYNAEMYMHFGIGDKLEMETLTDEQFRKSIEKVISNESYRKNIANLREVMNDQPQPPLERAIWWTEHVLRHGGAKHLRSPAANMTWTEYYELNLVFTLLISSILVLSVIVFVILKAYNLVVSSFKIKVKTN